MPAPDPLAVGQAEQLFSLKEWMVAISAKLDRMEVKLDGKADIIHVQQMDNRLLVLEKQFVESEAEKKYLVPQHIRLLEDVGVLKTKAAAISSVDNYRRWVWGVAAVAIINITLNIMQMAAN